MRKGFTLIEMLVTVALIAIVSGAIIIGINPTQRIRDAQDARAKQDVRSVAAAVEACLAYASTTGATNDPSTCYTAAQLYSGANGAPFTRSSTFPTGVTTTNPGGATGTVCITSTGYSTWYFSTGAGVVNNTAC